MPRVSRVQTAANREAIETVSARLFREQGLNGVSVADLMGAAGLTHGGFYGHFDSKDALAGAACEHAFQQSRQRREKWRNHAPDAETARHAFIERYLSTSHRDNPGTGCPVAALAADVGREARDKPVHGAYLAGMKSMVDEIASGCDADDAQQRRDAALVQIATMVGALILARATKGDPLSGRILAAARAALAASDAPDNA